MISQWGQNPLLQGGGTSGSRTCHLTRLHSPLVALTRMAGVGSHPFCLEASWSAFPHFCRTHTFYSDFISWHCYPMWDEKKVSDCWLLLSTQCSVHLYNKSHPLLQKADRKHKLAVWSYDAYCFPVFSELELSFTLSCSQSCSYFQFSIIKTVPLDMYSCKPSKI